LIRASIPDASVTIRDLALATATTNWRLANVILIA
jgi:hypothetical protein